MLCFLQDIANTVILIFCLSSLWAYHPYYPASTITKVLSLQTVKASLLHDTTESVKTEGIAFTALVDNLTQLQLTVITETHMMVELTSTDERSQWPILELHLAQPIRSYEKVTRCIIGELVHIAIRFMQAYQIVSIIIVVGCNVAFDIRSLDKSSTLIILPCSVNAIWEDKLLEFLLTAELAYNIQYLETCSDTLTSQRICRYCQMQLIVGSSAVWDFTMK